MDFFQLKTMMSALPSNFENKSFSPLVITNDSVIVSEGHVIVKYNTETNLNKISISYEDFNKIKNLKNGKIIFKNNLYIDDNEFKNSENYLIYKEFDRLYNKAVEDNQYILPLFKLENCNCDHIVINQHGIHYISDDIVIKSTTIKIPQIVDTINGYVCVQYKYIKNVLNIFKSFNVIPIIKYGSSFNIVFTNNEIKSIIMQCKLVSKYDFKNLKEYEDDEW